MRLSIYILEKSQQIVKFRPLTFACYIFFKTVGCFSPFPVSESAKETHTHMLKIKETALKAIRQHITCFFEIIIIVSQTLWTNVKPRPMITLSVLTLQPSRRQQNCQLRPGMSYFLILSNIFSICDSIPMACPYGKNNNRGSGSKCKRSLGPQDRILGGPYHICRSRISYIGCGPFCPPSHQLLINGITLRLCKVDSLYDPQG